MVSRVLYDSVEEFSAFMDTNVAESQSSGKPLFVLFTGAKVEKPSGIIESWCPGENDFDFCFHKLCDFCGC